MAANIYARLPTIIAGKLHSSPLMNCVCNGGHCMIFTEGVSGAVTLGTNFLNFLGKKFK